IGPIEWMGISEVVNPMAQVLNVTYCPGSVNAVPPVNTVSGRVVYYDLTKPVPDVTVEIQGPAQAATFTDGLGNYLFEDLYSGDYQVYAYRFNDDSGVTVADAVKMRRHLAQIELFDSPYKMIAGDVNVSSTVSIADVIVIRRYLAMLDTLPCGNWVFVDSGFAVTMDNWFNAPRDMRITIINHDVVLKPFIGIRMGDVNNTWGSPKGMFAKPAGGEYVSVGIGEVTALEGESVAIPVTLANASDMAGMEIHVGYDAHVLTYTGVSSETFQNMTLNGHDGAIHMVWEDINAPKQLNGEQTVITLNFQVTGNLPTSTEINVTGAEVVNSQGDPYRLAVTNGYLYNGNGGSSSLPNTYSLAQNSPNPFNPTTTIRAAMADGGEFTLTVFNIMGEKVRQYRGWHAAGPLEITWDARNDDGAQVPSGIYLYRFQAGSFSQTRQMILLK
ncbi:MAG: cohesin domain-containing protein, partial [candidate division Zixibacteria bacterium]|nr:cohesin domain-containing protein [candidate division Zixibacteria bacterium]